MQKVLAKWILKYHFVFPWIFFHFPRGAFSNLNKILMGGKNIKQETSLPNLSLTVIFPKKTSNVLHHLLEHEGYALKKNRQCTHFTYSSYLFLLKYKVE